MPGMRSRDASVLGGMPGILTTPVNGVTEGENAASSPIFRGCAAARARRGLERAGAVFDQELQQLEIGARTPCARTAAGRWIPVSAGSMRPYARRMAGKSSDVSKARYTRLNTLACGKQSFRRTPSHACLLAHREPIPISQAPSKMED